MQIIAILSEVMKKSTYLDLKYAFITTLLITYKKFMALYSFLRYSTSLVICERYCHQILT